MKVRVMMKFAGVLLAVAAACVAGEPQAPDYEAIVVASAPFELQTAPMEKFGTPPGEIRSGYVRFTPAVTGSVKDAIVAAYTNANDAYVRLLTKEDDAWRVAKKWTLPELASSPVVTVVDFDADGIDEVVVQVGVGARDLPRHWIFRWTGSTLVAVSSEGDTVGDDPEPGSDLAIAEAVDLDGDGHLEVIGATTEEFEVTTDEGEVETRDRDVYYVQPYANGKLGSARTLTAFFSLVVPKKRGSVLTEEFEVEAPTAFPSELRIVRRGTKANWHTSGAELRLNGQICGKLEGLQGTRRSCDTGDAEESQLGRASCARWTEGRSRARKSTRSGGHPDCRD